MGDDNRFHNASAVTVIRPRYEGKVAIVTGAASGIGRATARLLASEGARVVMCDIDDAVDTVQREIEESGGDAAALHADVTVQADVDGAVAAAGARIDLMANVAGVADYFLPVGELDDETWRRTLDINLGGTMRFVRAVVPIMERQGGGAIVNIASVAGLGGGAGGVAYTAAKHGVIGLTKSTAFLYGPKLVRCNAVCPGGVATPIIQTSAFAKVPWVGERLAASFARVDRVAEPEDIAELVAFLGSDAAANINGAVITSDGGWMAG